MWLFAYAYDVSISYHGVPPGFATYEGMLVSNHVLGLRLRF